MHAQPTLHELDHRVNDGIDVWLLWRSSDDQLIVAVSDAKTDEAFTIEVAPGERPLDVFHHPYAYRRTVRAGDPISASAEAESAAAARPSRRRTARR